MEAHGIGDHGSIVEEVEAEWEFQVVEVVAQVAEAVAQVAEVVGQVAVVEDLDDFLDILWKWKIGKTLGRSSKTSLL